jgi:hypothetical protein
MRSFIICINSSLNIIGVIELRKKRWAVHVARMREEKICLQDLAEGN